MEMNTIGKAILTTAATGLAVAGPANAHDHCFDISQSNSSGYDIYSLISSEYVFVRPDIAIDMTGYVYEPVVPHEMESVHLEEAIASDGETEVVLSEQQNEALDVADMVARVKVVFGLNGVQMAQAVRISRPSLYNHLKGMDCDQSIERYNVLYSLANEVSELVCMDIRRGLKSVLVDGKTLLSYLKEEELNREKILEVSQLIAQKISGAPKLPSEEMNAKDQIHSSRSISRIG